MGIIIITIIISDTHRRDSRTHAIGGIEAFLGGSLAIYARMVVWWDLEW